MLDAHLDHFLKWACGWGYNSIIDVLALQTGNPPEKARMVPKSQNGASACNTSVEEANSQLPGALCQSRRDPVAKYEVAGGLGATPEVVL